jgi:hypothetical protein
MTLRPVIGQSEIDKACIAEYARLHPEEVREAKQYAESQGLIKPKPRPTPEELQAAVDAVNRPREVDGRLIRQNGTPILPVEVEPVLDAPIGSQPAPLKPMKYQVEQREWRE